jgi:hypothetical protein
MIREFLVNYENKKEKRLESYNEIPQRGFQKIKFSECHQWIHQN